MKRILIGLFLAGVACTKREAPTLTSAAVDAGSPENAELATAAQRWNAAISQRDLSLLTNAYASHVTFYGIPLRHDQVIQIRSDEFTKDPSFTQSVADVRVVSPSRVELERKWVTLGTRHSEKASLDLVREDGRWVVAGEGEARASQANDACAGLATRMVLSSKKASALAGVDVNNDVHVANEPPTWPMYSVAIVENEKDVATTVGWYDVVPSTGELSDALTGETLAADPGLVAQMRKCAR